MPDEHFVHIIVRNVSRGEKFARPGTGGSRRLPSRVPDRQAHATKLLQQLQRSQDAAKEEIARRSNVLTQAQNGIYLAINGRAQEPLLTERFERRKKNIELLAVKEEAGRTTATIFVPESAKDFLSKTIEDYRTKDEPRAKEPEPKGRRLVEGIDEIQLAVLRDLWIDAPDRFPDAEEVIDWEVWLRPSASDRFRVAAMEAGVAFGAHPLVFPEDVALFVRSSPRVLAQLNEATLSISRVARSKSIAEFLLAAAPDQQTRAMDEFLRRVSFAERSRNSLCMLDTGVKREHRLLEPLIAPADCHAYRDDWGADDHHGHGTAMAGVCGYGDLASAIGNGSPVTVPYRMEQRDRHVVRRQRHVNAGIDQRTQRHHIVMRIDALLVLVDMTFAAKMPGGVRSQHQSKPLDALDVSAAKVADMTDNPALLIDRNDLMNFLKNIEQMPGKPSRTHTVSCRSDKNLFQLLFSESRVVVEASPSGVRRTHRAESVFNRNFRGNEEAHQTQVFVSQAAPT